VTDSKLNRVRARYIVQRRAAHYYGVYDTKQQMTVRWFYYLYDAENYARGINNEERAKYEQQ
jgi:hypothetical protein